MTEPDNKNLFECKTCKGTVARKAKVCPHCGQRKPAVNPEKKKWLKIAFIIFGGWFMLSLLTDQGSHRSVSRPSGSNSGGEPIMGVSRAEAEKILSQEYPENAGKALAECARKIVGYYGLDHQAGNVPAPSYQDFSNGEFVYSWSKDSMALQSVLGRASVSASCMGTLKPLKIEHVSVNGKDAL